MKKIPRNIGADELIKLLGKQYQYFPTRQSGSHVRLTIALKGQHHIHYSQSPSNKNRNIIFYSFRYSIAFTKNKRNCY